MDSATYLTPVANPKTENYSNLISQEDSAMLETEGLYVEPNDSNFGQKEDMKKSQRKKKSFIRKVCYLGFAMAVSIVIIMLAIIIHIVLKFKEDLSNIQTKGSPKNGHRVGYCCSQMCKNGGLWYLGMNLNPSDGHIMDFLTGWEEGKDYGRINSSFTKDYINQTVWNMPVHYIAIVRHQRGHAEAVKVWKLKESGKSMLTWFKTSDRKIASKGGPKQVFIIQNMPNGDDDPIFSIPGDIAINWKYYNNGNRLVLTGGHLSTKDSNDENTHGLGNHICLDKVTAAEINKCRNEISNTQDCPYPKCPNKNITVQGTDNGSDFSNGSVYGNYAIYVSKDAERFPTCNKLLMPEMEEGW